MGVPLVVYRQHAPTHKIPQYSIQIQLNFNKNILNFHQYYNDKLSFHQPSPMPTPDTEEIKILIIHFLIIQELKKIVPSHSHMEPPPKFA